MTRHYRQAPITEALIDLRVDLPEDLEVAHLRRTHDGEESRYPHVQQLNVAVGQLQIGQQLATSASARQVGFWFRSAEGRQVYQARLDGFTLSRLAPYDGWVSFRDEARRLWSVYRSTTQPKAVTRLAVRYVNRIDIPVPVADYQDYLRTAPVLSNDLPQALSGFFMRLAIPFPDICAQCVLNEAMIDPVRNDVVSIALDIDLFRIENVPDDDESIWRAFETLRERKNQVFEACITDRTRGLFD